MGISMNATTAMGVSGTYWKIIDFTYRPAGVLGGALASGHLDTMKPTAFGHLGLYASRDMASCPGVKPMMTESFAVTIEYPTRDILAQVYQAVRSSHQLFSRAEDIIEQP